MRKVEEGASFSSSELTLMGDRDRGGGRETEGKRERARARERARERERDPRHGTPRTDIEPLDRIYIAYICTLYVAYMYAAYTEHI